MALIERAALRVLPGQADWIALQNDGAKSQRFRETVVHRALSMPHLGALFEEFHDLRMNVEALGGTDESIGDFRQLFPREAAVPFIFRLVSAMRIRRPIFRQLPKVRDLFQRARFALLFLVFLTDR